MENLQHPNPRRSRYRELLVFTAVFCAAFLAAAQTNELFQNCRAGDVVKVKCDRPILVLSKATLVEIGSNTVTVCTPDDRFTLDKTNVVLLPLEPAMAAAAAVAPGGGVPLSAPAVPAAPGGGGQITDYAQTMESIRASVIDPCKTEAYKEPKLVNGQWVMLVDPNSPGGQARYDKANEYYRTTMAGVMNGSITQEDLVRKAKEELKQIDQLQKDGVDISLYADNIQVLRDFVRRSEAGEKFNFAVPVQ